MKRRKDSFASRLSQPQRDELFQALAGGLGLEEATAKIHAWTKAEWGGKPPSTQAVSAWFTSEKVLRRFTLAAAAGAAAEEACPTDYSDRAKRAIGQGIFLAAVEGASAMDLAFFEKNQIAREKLELDKQKLAMDVRITRRNLALDRTRILLERARGGEKSEDLQKQIDLALDEIHKLKHGEDAA